MSIFVDRALGELEKELGARDGGRGSGGGRDKAQRVLDRLFLQQRDFVLDPHRYKALLTPRRCGKSIAALGDLLSTALMHPRSELVYTANTRLQAKQVLWDEFLQWNQDLELGLEFNIQELTIRTPGGSKIILGGAETEADINRYRGRKFRRFYIDEPGSLRPAILDALITKVVVPALRDYSGTLCLTGTPGMVLDGLFFKTTGPPAFEIVDGKAMSRPFAERHEPKWRDVKFSWSFHRWGLRDNIAVKCDCHQDGSHMYAEALAEKQAMGWSDDHPTWLREGVGQWAADGQVLVFKHFDPSRNTWKPAGRSARNPFGLPEGFEWRYVLGIDMGRSIDPCAMTLAAFSENHPAVYQVWEWQQWKVLPKDLASKIKELGGLVEIEHAVADWGPYGDLVQEQLLKEHGIAIESAQKRDKMDHIELLNGDYVDGRAFLLEGGVAATQSLYLCWDDTGMKEATDRSAEGRVKNDCTDAFLYCWRWLRHHFSQPKGPPAPKPGSHEALMQIEQERLAELALRQEAMDRLQLGQGDYYDTDGAWD